MAFTKFKTKDLAQSATLKKSRRRRIVFLSTSKPQPFDRRHRRPSIKSKYPLFTMAEPQGSPKMDPKATYISSALKVQPKSKAQSPKPLRKTCPEINLIKQERETSSETSDSSNSSSRPPSIFDHDEVNGKPGPVDTPPSSPASETAPDSEKKKSSKEQESKTTTTADSKPKKRPVEQAKSIRPQNSSQSDSAKHQASTSRKDFENPAKKTEKPRHKKKTEMVFQRKQFLENLDRRWPNTEVGGKGMVNPGIFCYRRSVLQCLLNIPLFVNWLSEHHTEGGNMCPGTFEGLTRGKTVKKRAPACLACALVRLAKAYWEPESKQGLLQATRHFDQTMAKIALETTLFPTGIMGKNEMEERRRRKFEVCNGQQDAGEFFRWILQVLEEHGQMKREEINSIFQHVVKKEFQCPGCGRASPSQQEHKNLMVSIPKRAASLEDCIAESLRTEIIDGWHCENKDCRHHSKKVPQLPARIRRRTTGIFECPEIMVVQLLRFEVNSYGSLSKLNTAITYPPVLDLTSRLDPQSTEKTARYSLSGVARQWGTIDGGHYWATSVTPKGVRTFDDDVVFRSKLQELVIPKEGEKGKITTPYLIFYTRLRDDEPGALSQLAGKSKTTPTKTTTTQGTPMKSGKETSPADNFHKRKFSNGPTPTSSSKKHKKNDHNASNS